MFHVKNLSAEEKLTLEIMLKNHPCHAPRMRAHAVLLSDAGFSLNALSATFDICRQTAASWLHSCEDGGVCALFDKPRSGRPCKLSEEQKHEAIELVKKSPRSLKNVLAQLAEEFGIELSRSTLKRLSANRRSSAGNGSVNR